MTQQVGLPDTPGSTRQCQDVEVYRLVGGVCLVGCGSASECWALGRSCKVWVERARGRQDWPSIFQQQFPAAGKALGRGSQEVDTA